MRFFYPQAIVRCTVTVNRSLTELDPVTSTFMATPRECTIERNPFNEADTCHLEFDLQAFPVMPRMVQQIHVQVYAGDSGSIDSETVDVANSRFLSFVGYANDPEASLEETDDKISFKCVDYTSLFLEAKRANPKIAPSYSERLDVALRRICDAVPGGENISLKLEGLSAWPQLSTGAPRGMKGKVPTKPEDNLWDYVKRACDPCNLIPQIKLDALVVAPSRGLVAPSRQAVFIYGENLTEYKEKKDLKKSREGIGLRAWDSSAKRNITAVYPPEGDVRVIKHLKAAKKKNVRKPPPPRPIPGAEGDKRAWFPYPPVANQHELDDAAERIYLQRRFQEFSGSFTCHAMVVDGEGALGADEDSIEIDVTQLANGDRIQLDIARKTRTFLAGFDTHAKRVSALIDEGYEEGAANLIVEIFESKMDRALEVYVTKADHKYTADGYELAIEFRNLIDGDAK